MRLADLGLSQNSLRSTQGGMSNRILTSDVLTNVPFMVSLLNSTLVMSGSARHSHLIIRSLSI